MRAALSEAVRPLIVSPSSLRDFYAADTGVDRNEFGTTVGFARDANDEQSLDAFLLQRAAESADTESIDDGVYLEVPTQRYAAYDVIESATLKRDSIELRLSASGVAQIGGIGGFRASFTVSDTKFAELQQALRLVFLDCSYYEETL